MSRQSGRIVRELHDEPQIVGRQITVRFVHNILEGRGLATLLTRGRRFTPG